MNETKTENVKKKGILATIWDSMTKTGGCCGSGGNCGCGPAKLQASKGNQQIDVGMFDDRHADRPPGRHSHEPFADRGGPTDTESRTLNAHGQCLKVVDRFRRGSAALLHPA